MKKHLLSIALCLSTVAAAQAQTLSECYDWAEQHYPLIQQYELIAKTKDYTVATASKAWLPQVVVSAQATYQSDVVAFPEQFNALYQNMGLNLEGMHKDQYRIGVDVNQTIWDGGAIKAQKQMAEADAQVQQKSVESQLYELRERINSLFFGTLILNEQADLNDRLQSLLQSNINRVEALVKDGMATQSDLNSLQVELLQSQQNRASIEASKAAFVSMLETFTARSVTNLQMPPEPSTETSNVNRPELALFDSRTASINAQRKVINSSYMPRISAFAQGFYGYPGLNMFDDMLKWQFSWNYIVGVRLQWNIGNLYNSRTNSRKIALAACQIAVDRDMFLFNNNLAAAQQRQNIAQRRTVIEHDDQIVTLRQAIRQACENKVANGVADVNDLLREITAEYQASIARSSHRIELLEYLYDLKTTLNN